MSWKYRILTWLLILFSACGGLRVAHAEVTAVPDGTTLQPGQIVLLEEVNFASKVIAIAVGVLDYPYNVGVNGDIHRNAWRGYSTLEEAQLGACQQAAERKTQPLFAGFDIKTQGVSCPGIDSSAPVAPPQQPAPSAPSVQAPTVACQPAGIIPVMPGDTLPAGHAAIVREVDHATQQAWVYWTDGVPEPLLAGSGYDGNPLHERAIWHQCSGLSWAWIAIDACNEVTELWRGLLGYVPKMVYLNGIPTQRNSCR